MIKIMKSLFAVVLMTSALLVVGCSSHPSDEELATLNNLKQEVSSLERQLTDKQREKADLEKQIAEKNGKLQQCQSDQEAVKKGLGK